MQLEEKAQHYREMARSALEHAEVADRPEVREEFMLLAYSWHMLALQAESMIAD